MSSRLGGHGLFGPDKRRQASNGWAGLVSRIAPPASSGASAMIEGECLNAAAFQDLLKAAQARVDARP